MVPYGGRDVPANVSCEEVTLDSPLRPGKTSVLETYSALAHQLRPRPKEILQGENQRVLLTAAQHTISPYPISSETTEVHCLPLMALRLPLGASVDGRFPPHQSIPHPFRDSAVSSLYMVALDQPQYTCCACVMGLMHLTSIIVSARCRGKAPRLIGFLRLQLKLLSRVVESYAGAKPVSKSGSTIKYGPYSNIAPFSGGTLSAHFENNSPFLDALSLVREIEVSHWGNVYVEEWYNVKHMGAQHKV